MNKWIILTGVLAALVLASGCIGGSEISYKDCVTNKTCVEAAIYNDCAPAKADLGRVQVTVSGEQMYGSSKLKQTTGLCEVNFKYADREKTCAFPVYDKKTIEWYEWADEYCTIGSEPPKSFK